METDSHCPLDGSRAIRSILAALLACLGGAALSCNTHPVSYQPASGTVDRIEDTTVGGGAAVDILWVIDNSGSMCQEQAELRANFRNFIDQLGGEAVDFNIAVTTTQYETQSDRRFDPVARPGHIQSTPSPVTGALDACKYAPDSQGRPLGPEYRENVDNPDDNVNPPNYKPISNQIRQAVNCTQNPDQFENLLKPSEDELACAIDDNQAACNAIDKDSSKFNKGDLFPPQEAYRDIDKVLRASDPKYSTDDGLDKEKLAEDFACMSFVGTRGRSIEQGLRSAARTVSPELTGGPAELSLEGTTDEEQGNYDPNDDGESEYNPDAPNHEFIRRNASFALIFVTDENDCSLQQNLAEIPDDREKRGCTDRECYFFAEQDDPSPLATVDELYNRFMTNLAQSKGLSYSPDQSNPDDPDTLDPQNVLAASIHGTAAPQTVKQPNPLTSDSEQCTNKGDDYVLPTCTSKELGVARTGGRYEDFIRNFARSFPQPNPNAPDDPLRGEICQGSLSSAIEGIGSFIETGDRSCIPNRIFPCESNDECPRFEFGSSSEDTSRCHSGNFCRSAIQVQLNVPEEASNPEQKLQQSGYCLEGSIGSQGLSRGCIVKRSRYSWKADQECGSGSGVTLEWNEPTRVKFDLSAFDVNIRYTEQIRGTASASDDVGTTAADGSN